jgi:hypothetical protein
MVTEGGMVITSIDDGMMVFGPMVMIETLGGI